MTAVSHTAGECALLRGHDMTVLLSPDELYHIIKTIPSAETSSLQLVKKETYAGRVPPVSLLRSGMDHHMFFQSETH